ncbi:MAG: CBS domain-containing protein [Candidatus Bathyarchaeota archaeon]|jgi:CBS domain-containing protein
MEGMEPPSTVQGVMSKPVITIEMGNTVQASAEIMSKKNAGSIIVTKKSEPIGIVTERDILRRVVAKGLDGSRMLIEEIMSKPLVTISENIPIIEAIRILQKKKIRRLLILDKNRLVGIVTQRDLLRALALHVIISFRPLLKMA